MQRLNIKEIDININTPEGQFGVKIPFDYGLNIIRANNSYGKVHV